MDHAQLSNETPLSRLWPTFLLFLTNELDHEQNLEHSLHVYQTYSETLIGTKISIESFSVEIRERGKYRFRTTETVCLSLSVPVWLWDCVYI